jgi:hypothetical protein
MQKLDGNEIELKEKIPLVKVLALNPISHWLGPFDPAYFEGLKLSNFVPRIVKISFLHKCLKNQCNLQITLQKCCFMLFCYEIINYILK